jgi:hypothetical protein
VTTMYFTFASCKSLTTLNLGRFPNPPFTKMSKNFKK